MKILVTAAGGAIGQGIIKSVKRSALQCVIVTADTQPDSAGLYRGNAGYIVPFANDGNYIDEIIKICNKENVDGIFIGTDYELLKFSENKKRIEKETAAKVIVSSPEKIKIAEDKWLTYKFLFKNKFPLIPSTLMDGLEDFVDEIGFPLIIKPRIGDSSKDTFVVKNKEELSEKTSLFKEGKTTNVYTKSEPIIQEYIATEKDEYTSTALTFNNHCYGVLSMRREMRFGGHTTKAILDDYSEINKTIRNMAEKFSAFGPANFQSRFHNGLPRVFEINCRFSGTTPFCAEVGFNTAEAVIRHVILKEPIQELKYEAGIVLRYFNEVFIPIHEFNKLQRDSFIKNPKSRVNNIF